jgi:hypothetical protein
VYCARGILMAIGAEEDGEAVLIRHFSFGTVVDVVESRLGVPTADVAHSCLGFEYWLPQSHLPRSVGLESRTFFSYLHTIAPPL